MFSKGPQCRILPMTLAKPRSSNKSSSTLSTTPCSTLARMASPLKMRNWRLAEVKQLEQSHKINECCHTPWTLSFYFGDFGSGVEADRWLMGWTSLCQLVFLCWTPASLDWPERDCVGKARQKASTKPVEVFPTKPRQSILLVPIVWRLRLQA